MAFYFEAPAWIISFGILASVIAVLWKRKYSVSYLFCFATFWIYLSFVLKETLFPIEIVPERAAILGGYFADYINLIPFYFGRFARFDRTFPGVFLNILLTMPFGFGINFLTRLRPRSFLWLSISVGMAIESSQLLISLCLGYPYRVIDINDVICNAAGVLIGYALFRLFARGYILLSERFELTQPGLLGYFLEIAQKAAE
jgi:glycopeptide antibiotics resistance protein